MKRCHGELYKRSEVKNIVLTIMSQLMPKEVQISRIEFEGPEIAIYTKDPALFVQDPQIIRRIAKTIKKRIVIRTDPSIRKPHEIAKKIVEKFKAIEQNRDVELNTSMASEFDVLQGMFEKIRLIEVHRKDDEKFLQEAKKIIEKVKDGWYSDQITDNSQNPLLESFKNDVNDMIRATKGHFEKVNKILDEYSKNNFTNELN